MTNPATPAYIQGSVAPQEAAQARWQQEMGGMPPQVPQETPLPTAVASIDNARTTQYGWSTDPNQDYNTNVLHLGNHDNPLTPHVAALSDDMVAKLHANPGDVLRTNSGDYYYGDRAGVPGRVDLYAPNGMNKILPDFQSIKNLGGGSSTLKGNDLSTTGEANVQRLSGQIDAPNPVLTTPPVAAIVQPQPQAKTGWNQRDGIAFINLLKGLKFGLSESPFANVPTNYPNQ